MGRSTVHLLQHALCEFRSGKSSGVKDRSDGREVGKHFGHRLWFCGFLRQAFDPSSIPAYLRTNENREHVYVRRSSTQHLDYPHILPRGMCVRDLHMHASGKDLEPANERRSLL